MNSSGGTKYVCFLISHYLWYIILLFLCVIPNFFMQYQKIGVIHTSEDQYFDPSADPSLYSHITDIHLNSFELEHNIDFENALNLSQKWNAKSVIFTGDLVDNWGASAKGFFGYGNAYEPDYKNLQNVLSKYNFTQLPLLDIPGNHDEYGVLGLDSENHYFIHYSHYFNNSLRNFTKENFWVDTTVIANDTFIYVNPYEWPMPHAKLGFWINAGKELLDLIEEALKQDYNTSKRYLITHFPVNLWSTRFKSSSGKSFKDLVGEYKIDMMLTGHTHPVSVWPQHFNGNLEVNGPDVLDHFKFGLVANDNGILTYHEVKIYEPITGIVTFPVQKEFLSKNTNFNPSQMFFRIVSFENESLNISYQIEGQEPKRMVYARQLADGQYLYQSEEEIIIPSGEYTVKFSGDFEKEINFYYGEQIDLGREPIYGYPQTVDMMLAFFGVFLIVNVFLTFPFEPFNFVKPYEEFLDGGNTDISSTLLFVLTICGFFPVRNRLQTSSLVVIITLFVLAIAPVIIPSVFFVDNGTTLGAVWIWGYAIQGKYHYDVYGTIFGGVYYLAILGPIVLGAAQIAKKTLFHFICGSVFLLIGFVVGIMVALIWGIQSAGYVLGILSPLFIILPLVAIIIILVYGIKALRSNIKQEFLPLNSSILKNSD